MSDDGPDAPAFLKTATWAPIPPECPVTGRPQIDRDDLDVCSCGHRHIKIECWGGGGDDR